MNLNKLQARRSATLNDNLRTVTFEMPSKQLDQFEVRLAVDRTRFDLS
jgi:hypothetical protein